MNIQLTISLLASDRIETLGKCLESVSPLLRELNSELVVVATGRDSAVAELVRQYSARIIPFTWCDDFSKARNTGLAEAKGEWFLYLDDDEWFEDVSEIVDFFCHIYSAKLPRLGRKGLYGRPSGADVPSVAGDTVYLSDS